MVGLFQDIGIAEILLILAVVLLLFGAKKLPEMARSLGRSSNEFKRGLKESGTDEGAERRALEATSTPGSEAAPAPAPAPAQATEPPTAPQRAPEKTSE